MTTYKKRKFLKEYDFLTRTSSITEINEKWEAVVQAIQKNNPTNQSIAIQLAEPNEERSVSIIHLPHNCNMIDQFLIYEVGGFNKATLLTDMAAKQTYNNDLHYENFIDQQVTDMTIDRTMVRHFQENMETPFVQVCSEYTDHNVHNGMDGEIGGEFRSMYDLLEDMVGEVYLASEIFSFCCVETGHLLYGKPWTYNDDSDDSDDSDDHLFIKH